MGQVVTGTVLNARGHRSGDDTRADGPQLESLNPLIEQRIIRPIVDSVFPFAQTAEAVARSEGGKARGKVIIQMRDD